MRLEFARLWQAAGRRRTLLVNIERRRGRPFLERGDRIRIAQKPDVVFWIVGRSEGITHLGPAQYTNDVDYAVRSTFGARPRVFAIGRHKPAVNDDDAATGKASWRKYPVARSFDVGTQRRPGRVHKGLFSIEKFGRKCDSTKFLPIFSKLLPTGTRREIFWRTGKPGIDRRNEVFLPDLSVELPHAKPDQNHETSKRHERRIQDAAFPLAASLAHISPRRSRRPSAAL